MIYYIDIDHTICMYNSRIKKDEVDYKKAIPKKKVIDKINKLYYTDNKIIIWTARGVGTGKNLRRLTVNQLREWGVKYHKLRMDKPLFDYFIDDKAINIKDW